MQTDSHFLSTGQWSSREFDDFLRFAQEVKEGRSGRSLQGRILGLLFFNPSLRTRTSFATAIYQLGGHCIDLNVGSGVWGIETLEGAVMDGDAAEHVREAAPVLSRYVDVLGVRAFARGRDWTIDRDDPILSGFARHSTVPVINLESSLWHPCQALADALTWSQLGLQQADKIVLTWAYHPRPLPMAVPHSVALAAVQRGLNLTILRPPEFGFDRTILAGLEKVAAENGGSLEQTDDLSALEDARVVYAKSWGSLQAYGRPEEERGIRDRYRHWTVGRQWLDRTDNASFMHCLPVRRNVVVSDEVLDSPSSVVVDQAENRLHVQKALLLRMIG